MRQYKVFWVCPDRRGPLSETRRHHKKSRPEIDGIGEAARITPLSRGNAIKRVK